MDKNYYIDKLENIICRIFNSIDSTQLRDVTVQYIGKKIFSNEEIDQRCFKFEKSTSDFLFFELLIPSNDNQAHTIALEQFMQQIIFKYNVENIACFLHSGEETDIDHAKNFEKDFIFEVSCTTLQGSHKVYINVDPEEFFE